MTNKPRGADTRDRDRGDNRSSAPPTPPYVRFRIRRFELVKLLTERPTKAVRARRVQRSAVQSTWPCSDSDAMALDYCQPCSSPSQGSRRVSPVPCTACDWFSTAARRRILHAV